jgi:hypothetical protein
MEFVIVLAILTVLVLVVSAPLRRVPTAAAPGPDRDRELAELDASRAAKYREIRDAELDHRTGKLSDADYEVLDQELRAEAVAILRELDRADERLPSGES